MNITFYGGAGQVTGSKHLLEVGGKRVLLDCGTFQGLPDMQERNRSFPFGPETIDAVVISHAHMDHIGMLPLLIKRGFAGKIYATPATKDVAQYMLQDAAGIEMQDAEYRRKHHIGAYDLREPLFTRDDIPLVINRFVTVPYARTKPEWATVVPGIEIQFYDAGHILGSAATVLRLSEDGREATIAYSGDVGPRNVPLMRDPEKLPDEVEMLLLESTYGGRKHDSLDVAITRLGEAIARIARQDGKMIVPSFSLGRTQLLVYVIHKLTDEGKIPRVPIFVDSPLATNVTEVYRRHSENFDEETARDFAGAGHRPLIFRNLMYTKSAEESKKLNVTPGPFIVIAGSGMMTGGRAVHHLRHCIADPRNAIFITGYQAEGTVGRRLIEGTRTIELYGDVLPVKASVEVFNEFSAHADGEQLLAYAGHIKDLKKVYLVHGEAQQADVLTQRMKDAHPAWHVERPKEGKTIEV